MEGDEQISRLTLGSMRTNCYILTDESRAELAIVDPPDEVPSIETAIEASGARPRLILLTHGHFDHIGGAAALSRRFDIPCAIHRDDVRLLRRAPAYALAFTGRRVDVPTTLIAFDDGDTLRFGVSDVQAIWTPGHTPGSTCYRFSRSLLSGDTLLRGATGRTDLPGSSASRLRSSVTALLERADPGAILLPGHGPEWSVPDAIAWWSAGACDPTGTRLTARA